MVDPELGETFTAKVERISNSGNGIVHIEEGEINIGPIRQNAVGETVKIRRVARQVGVCLTEEALKPGQESAYGSISHPEPDSLTGEVIVIEIDRETNDGALVGSFEGKDIRVENGEIGDIVEVKVQQDLVAYASGEVINTRGEVNTPSEKTLSDRLSSLRERTEESAVEDVPEDVSTSKDTTPEYSRSQAVKEYVKTRAAGVCEGCGEPAPFTSKTGEPYLHAHHVHELSDGGSDTPETVIALCPNCHYQVHHGEDGETYNQELIDILQDIE